MNILVTTLCNKRMVLLAENARQPDGKEETNVVNTDYANE